MTLDERRQIFEKIEATRGGRTLVCFFNFDRASEPALDGLSTMFQSDAKEALFRVLKESVGTPPAVDLCLYTRGGDTNAVWPIVSLLREFDPEFEVLVPFRCHSSGTLVALGAKRIHLGPLSELSPIDPSTGNQFNPLDTIDTTKRAPISVEDVTQYRTFILEQLYGSNAGQSGESGLAAFLEKLVERVHPLALGNIHRVHQQIRQLARNLLELHPSTDRKTDDIIDALTTRFYSHVHMINRHEAVQILGTDHVASMSRDLAGLLDELLRAYEDTFELRRPFFLTAKLGNKTVESVRFVGGVIESRKWAYIHETCTEIRQFSSIPANIQIQLPPGQPVPLVPGLPRQYEGTVQSRGWVANKQPRGVTT